MIILAVQIKPAAHCFYKHFNISYFIIEIVNKKEKLNKIDWYIYKEKIHNTYWILVIILLNATLPTYFTSIFKKHTNFLFIFI